MTLAKKHSIEASEEGGVRFLHFGSEWVQGAMRIARPYALELEYTREMMACLLLRTDDDWPKRVLQVGLGAGSLTKFWHRYFPQTLQTIVEINPAVVAMAYQSFKLPREHNCDGARIDIHIADGVSWMKNFPSSPINAKSGEKSRKGKGEKGEKPEHKFDCIMVDGYDANARFGALGTEDFYRDCRARLSKRGLLVLNLFGRTHGYKSQIDNLRAAFDNRVLALPPVEGGNAIAIAAVGETIHVDSQSLKVEALRVYKATGLKLAATIARMEQVGLTNDSQAVRADSRKRRKKG